MFKSIIIILLLSALQICLSATAVTLKTVTPQGVVFISERGNERIKPLPAGFFIPATAQNLVWDIESLTLSYTTPNEPDDQGELVADTAHTLTLTAGQIAKAEAYTPAATIPERVTKIQLKIALIAAGIDLDALVARLPTESRGVATILIDDATHFERSANMVATLGALAGLTDAEIDALFVAAARIDPTKI